MPPFVSDWFGSISYIALLWVFSTVLLLIGYAIVREQVRMEGAGSWITYILVGWVGALFVLPVLILCNIGTDYLLPYIAIGFLISIPVIHWGLPNVAPDFQINTLAASLLLAFLVGIGAGGAAFVTGEIDALIPISALTRNEFPTE